MFPFIHNSCWRVTCKHTVINGYVGKQILQWLLSDFILKNSVLHHSVGAMAKLWGTPWMTRYFITEITWTDNHSGNLEYAFGFVLFFFLSSKTPNTTTQQPTVVAVAVVCSSHHACECVQITGETASPPVKVLSIERVLLWLSLSAVSINNICDDDILEAGHYYFYFFVFYNVGLHSQAGLHWAAR